MEVGTSEEVADTVQVDKDASPDPGSSDGGEEKGSDSGCIFIFYFLPILT